MALIKKTINFTAQSVQNPWVSIPSGWSKVVGSDDSRINNRAPIVWEQATGSNSIVRDDSVLSGRYRCAEVTYAPFASMSSASGAALLDSSNNGICAITSSSNPTLRIYPVIAGQSNTSVALWTSSASVYAASIVLRLIYDDVDKKYRTYINGVQVFATGGIEYTSATYAPVYASAISRYGFLVELSSEYNTSFSIDTLTDPLVAGAAFSGTSTGFANGSATLSSNGVSVAVTIASGAFSGTWPQAVDGQPYPTLPKSAQTITLTQGADTATITSDLEPADGHEIVNFVAPITDDDTYPPYYIEQDGFTAEGGQFVFTPYSDLVMAANGEVTVTGAGTLVGYFIPATGTGAGNAYYYTFRIIDGGDVVSGGLSVVGLTTVGLSVTGLSVIGL